jgi:uncharacterized membrane protein (UPF0136 family)
MNSLTITASYAALIFVGGLIGFLMAGSVPSLVASSIFATLLTIAAFGFYKDLSWAYPLSLSVATLMTLFFTYRYFATQTPVPLAMALFSLLTAVLLYKKG